MNTNKISKKCGTEAVDEYDMKYERSYSGALCRTHTIRGSGKIINCNAENVRKYRDIFNVDYGITELGNNCFSRKSVAEVNLPDSLLTIGNNCFLSSSIDTIILPEGLRKIGHSNFPNTLSGTFNIPSSLNDFPLDNIRCCSNISRISVSAGNPAYTVIDNVLYNKEVTIALFCPRPETKRIVLPNTVKVIGAYCFSTCTNLSAIEIPYSVEVIEEHAFSWVKINKLIIPNSVKEIGQSAFQGIRVNNLFKLSTGVFLLPDSCFERASLPSVSFIKHIKEIGNNCFLSYQNKFPQLLEMTFTTSIGDCAFKDCRGVMSVILPRVITIGEFAFQNCGFINNVELCSRIQKIGDSAFSGIGNLNMIFNSYIPIEVGSQCFDGIGDDSVLKVPKGTKTIFEHANPWNAFANIEEYEIGSEINGEDADGGLFSDQKYYMRLESIAYSLNNDSRVYVHQVLADLIESYKYVETENECEEIISLLDYNNKFAPPIISVPYNELTQSWSNKYKYRFAEYYMFHSLGVKIATESIQKEETLLPTLPQIEIANPIPQSFDEIEIYFDDILKHIQAELSIAKKSVRIAVSWFTNFALFKQIEELANNGIEVQLILNNDAINNRGYCLDLNALIKAGVHISLVQYPHMLHHKFCIIDETTVINGSYNWSRFSEYNYENITIFRNNDYVTQSFLQEFDRLLDTADLKDVTEMPEFVPQRPEYDRYAFRQYITEELDAQARAVSEEREKIAALHKASKLNPEYLAFINPEAAVKYADAFNVQDQAEATKSDIIEIIQTVTPSTKELTTVSSANEPTFVGSESSVMLSERKQSGIEVVIDKIIAPSLFMAVDVSGSMKNTFQAGHVHNIIRKALAAALAMSESREVSLWTFGTDCDFVGNVGLDNISRIQSVTCKDCGTDLSTFVLKAASNMAEKSLVIILTDDDGKSIQKAFVEMKKYPNVFWQIISYDASCVNISKTIAGVRNSSLTTLRDYANKTDKELSQILLRAYISWQQNNKS